MKNKNGRKVKRLRWNRSFVVLASVLVLIIGLVGTTLAWIAASTEPVKNTFTPSNVTTTITENFENNVKNNVQVKNTGDIDAYIRAMVVVTWQNDAHEVYPTAPVEGTDYTVSYPGNGWVKHTDGYYYYTSAVAPNVSTGVLLTNCKPVDEKTPDGYHLVVEILSDAIQAEPASAVTEAWGVNPTTLGDSDSSDDSSGDSYAGGIK